MNGDSFSLKARRTTRLPLRIPILLIFQDKETNKERTLDAWTLIVNVNGARVECKHLFAMSQEVVLRVPHLGKSQKGAIVWLDSGPNKNGSYECGIKLDKAENLWGVGFPPADWTPKAHGIDDLLPDKAVPAAPAEAPPPPTPATSETAQAVAAEAHSERLEPEPPAAAISAEVENSIQGGLMGNEPTSGDVQRIIAPKVDLTGDLSGLNTAAPSDRTMGLLGRKSEQEAGNADAPGLATHDPSTAVSDSVLASPATIPPEVLQESLLPAMGAAADGTKNPSDRLSNIFHELVESALQQRLRGLVEGLAARMEKRIAEVASAGVTLAEQQIANVITSHSESLESRAVEIVSSRQRKLEEDIRQYLTSQAEAARRAQQERLEDSLRRMQEESAQATAAASERLGQQAEELALTARTNLWQNVQQELPAIEKNVFARSQAQAEQAMAASLDEMKALFPQRIQEVELSAQQQMDRLAEERLSQFSAALAARTEQLHAESSARIEQQVRELWGQASQAFLRHIVSELNQKKQAWMQEAEGNLKRVTNQNLTRTRHSMTELLKNLGTSLVEQACTAAEERSEQMATDLGSQGEQRDRQEMDRFMEAHIGQ